MSDVIEINVETGQVTVRDYTSKEIKNRNSLERPQDPIIEFIEPDENKVSAINKLKTLGLTEAEAKALAGI